MNGGASLRVTPTELLFNAIALNLPAGGSIAGDMRIHNWLGEVPAEAPAQSPTIAAGQKTVNATATIAQAKPPATGSPAINPVERAHAYVDVRLANISLRTINEITEPVKYTDLGLDTAVGGPVHVEWGGSTNDLPSSVVVTADLKLAPQNIKAHSCRTKHPGQRRRSGHLSRQQRHGRDQARGSAHACQQRGCQRSTGRGDR